MDLGIAGKWALVCAASKGLGRGCAESLAREGANLVITARGAEALEATAAAIRAANPGIQVRAVVGDIASPAGRAAALAACPQVDILVNNAGGPPPGDFRNWDRDAWIAALDTNMLTPIELIGPARTSQLGMVGPVSTLVLGVLVLGEPFTAWVAVGSLCVLAGVTLLARAR